MASVLTRKDTSVSNADYSEIVSDVRRAITSLFSDHTVIGFTVKSLPVIISKRTPTAETDGQRIVINPDFWVSIKPKERVALLAHEALHVVMMHVYRGVKFIEEHGPSAFHSYQIASDLKVNDWLESDGFELPKNGATFYWLKNTLKLGGDTVNQMKKMSTEELALELMRHMSQIPLSSVVLILDLGGATRAIKPGEKGGRGDSSGLTKNGDSRGGASAREGGDEDEVVANEGDPALSRPLPPEELEKKVIQIFAGAVVAAKTAGRGAGWAERLLSEIVSPEVHWKTLLRRRMRAWIIDDFGAMIHRTWSRPSRKGLMVGGEPVMPGKKFYGRWKVVVLVDTSGSIGLEELRKFLGEIYGITRDVSREADIYVVPWDAKVYDVFALKKPYDVKKLKLYGGGGTEILPALELVDSDYRDAFSIIILSDWDIYDLYSDKVKALLNKYNSRIIAVTTKTDPPIYLKRTLKIKLSS